MNVWFVALREKRQVTKISAKKKEPRRENAGHGIIEESSTRIPYRNHERLPMNNNFVFISFFGFFFVSLYNIEYIRVI